MIQLHCEFDTREEAELWRDGMYRAYHPAAYSTHIQISKAKCIKNGLIEDVWIAYGSRAESCD